MEIISKLFHISKSKQNLKIRSNGKDMILSESPIELRKILQNLMRFTKNRTMEFTSKGSDSGHLDH